MYSLDQTTDFSYRELHSFLDINTIPEFVKQGECLTKEAANSLPDEAFADKFNRAFPISSAPDVYISNAFYINKKAELIKLWGEHYANTVQGRLIKAAELFEITSDIEKYNQNFMEKSAQDYAEHNVASFVIGNTSYDLFPYKTAEDVVSQADQFAKNISNYPFGWRPKIASAFVKQAAELGIKELPDIICKYGGMFFPDAREFQETLARRMRKLGQEDQQKYQECLTKAASMSSREDALNICEAAYYIEKAAGVYEKPMLYREMGDIVDRTMTLTLDKIAEYLNVVKMAGDCYKVSDLQKVDKDIFKQAFGVDIDPAKTAELKEILPTMPNSDVALFRELSGISAI